MSISGQTQQQQLQHLKRELQNELTFANQLLRSISIELQMIKQFTSSGGDFEAIIMENASLIGRLANLQHVDLSNLPQFERNLNMETNDEIS